MAVLVLLSICCNKSSENQQDKYDANIEIAKSVFEYFNSHDWQGMANLYVENAEFKDPEYALKKLGNREHP